MRAVLVALAASIAAATAAKPNLIFILTDDQDKVLDSEQATPMINKLIRDAGASIETGIVSTPICCPSRTISVSGRYSHNNGYTGSPKGSCMHVAAEERVFDKDAAFAQLKAAGYVTAAVGKVTNDQDKYFCKDRRRDSMDYVYAPCSFNDYWTTNYFTASPGKQGMTKIDDNASAYQTSQLGNFSVQWVQKQARRQRLEGDAAAPFFLWLGPHAPHFPADVAPWYAGAFNASVSPRVPSYNFSAPDHHSFISGNPYLDDAEASFADQHYRDRLRSLMSVDDMVNVLMQTLKAEGALDSTYIVYSSDHGYKLGHLNVPCSKQAPYETDLRVPLSWVGPGIRAGTKLDLFSSNVDFLPTWLELAGVDVPADVDGRSLAKILVTEPNRVVPHSSAEERASAIAGWRTGIIAEYLSVGTYYSDHCPMWFPANGSFQGQNVKAPKANAAGDLWYVDDTQSNSFRTLRFQNGTATMLYTEFDPSYGFKSLDSLQFVELYDLEKDPWSLDNIYDTITPEQRTDLFKRMSSYFECSGASCP